MSMDIVMHRHNGGARHPAAMTWQHHCLCLLLLAG